MMIDGTESAASVAHNALDNAIADENHAAVAALENATASVIEDAELRVQAAQEMAQRVTDAALNTELGRQITATNERVTECVMQGEQLRTDVRSLTETLQSVTERLSTLTGLTVAAVLPETQLAPATSSETTTEEQVQAILPEEVADSLAVVESPVPQKRTRMFR